MSDDSHKEFQAWLRTACFQAPPKHCESLAWSAWKEARRRFGPLPRALTAVNGAKAALSGEFFDTMNVTCPACCCGIVEDLTGERSACVECDGTGEISVKVPVTWTTIKAIWRRAVEHFEKQGD